MNRGVGATAAILPDRPGPVAEFWKGAQDGKLLLQRCRRCGHCWHPMSDVCASCQSFDAEWFSSAGMGFIYSYTVVHHAVHPAVESWVPYTVCLVQLDEGPRVLSTIDPDTGVELEIGSRVRLGFRILPGGFRLPVFQLDGPSSPGTEP